MKTDKLLHFLIAFPIFLLAVKVMAPLWALGLVVLIAIGKELLWDKWHERGTPEFWDAFATAMGGLTAWGLTLSILLMPTLSFSQVGIGTQDPQATLHIADADTLAYGLRVDKVPLLNSDMVLVKSPDGEIGYNVMATGDMPTFYAEQKISRIRYVNSRNLGIGSTGWFPMDMILPVTVAPNKTAMIFVDYYLPFGTADIDRKPRGYYGATFYRNGVEIENADSKTAINAVNDEDVPGGGMGQMGYSMGFAKNTYYENYTNNSGTPITITYEVKAYIEHAYPMQGQGVVYIFGFFDSSYNYNWGRGKIKIFKIEI